MGGARFMGTDKGTTLTKGQNALGIFFVWLIGGLLICFFLSILIFPTPNLIVPTLAYIFGVIFLFKRYSKIEKRSKD